MERRQLEQRLRLDLPTLADPEVRDLLQESDLFVRSFTGLGFGFGLFSPLDLVRVLSSVAELASQILLLYSASHIHSVSGLFSFWSMEPTDPSGRAHPPHLPLLGIILLPTLLSILVSCLPRLPLVGWANGDNFADNSLYTPTEAREQERAERMRSMAHGEPYRAEIALFGLAPWILRQWSEARKSNLGIETIMITSFPNGQLRYRNCMSISPFVILIKCYCLKLISIAFQFADGVYQRN